MANVPRLSDLEVRIMDLLTNAGEAGMYGAEFVATGIPEGSVYTTLARMVDKDLLESYRRSGQEGGSPRRYFRLTASGNYAISLHTKMSEIAEAMAAGSLDAS